MKNRTFNPSLFRNIQQKCWYCVLTSPPCTPAESEGSGTEMTPDQEARQVVKKIRRHVRLMNRKWAELNQRSNEWQHRIEEVLEVGVG